MDIDVLRVFVRVVESGSFAAAAREAGLGQPAVSKRIATLEQELGVQLLRRTSRTMALTDDGQAFYDSALRLVGDFDAALAMVGRGQAAPAGIVRVSVAPAFGRLYVVPVIAEFFAKYPAITVHLDATDRIVNLIEEGFDFAIQHGARADASTVARTIAVSSTVTLATPRYFEAHGTPKSPRDLVDHTCVVFAPMRTPRPWRFANSLVHKPIGPFWTADAEQLRAAVLADLGIAHAPSWIFASDLASGAVRPILRKHQLPAAPIKIALPAGRRVPTRVRALVDFLATAAQTWRF